MLIGSCSNVGRVEKDIAGRAYFRPRPFSRVNNREQSPVLLIHMVDFVVKVVLHIGVLSF
jgi:hypothetical protein